VSKFTGFTQRSLRNTFLFIVKSFAAYAAATFSGAPPRTLPRCERCVKQQL